MPAITFLDMVKDIAPHAPGVPDLVIERMARKVVRDLCQRARVWRGEATVVTVTPGVFEFAVTSPAVYGEFFDLLGGYFIDTADSHKTPIEYVEFMQLRRVYPEWPQNGASRPLVVSKKTPGQFCMAPVPDAGGTLTLFGCFRPTLTADSWDQDLYEEYSRAVFHGTLFELYMMPQRSWTDLSAAKDHGKIWSNLVYTARVWADKGYNTTSLGATMRPFA